MAEADAHMTQCLVFVFLIGSLAEPKRICAGKGLYQLHMAGPSTSGSLECL